MTSTVNRDTSLLLSGGGGHYRQIMTAFGELELAELREAFDEFDKVTTCGVSICDLSWQSSGRERNNLHSGAPPRAEGHGAEPQRGRAQHHHHGD